MLFVNADDFGLAENINNGIMATIERRAVNAVSLVANGEAFNSALRFLKKHPEVEVGVHLTLVEEHPLVDPERIPSLVGPAGKFCANYQNFLLKYFFGQINLREVRIELEAQIQKIIQSGLKITHCDSHQHLHLVPGIAAIVVELCQKYQIERLRIINEPLEWRRYGKWLPLLLLNYFSWNLKRMIKATELKTVERFVGFNSSMQLDQATVKKAISLSETKTVELMCHPGEGDQTSNENYSGWRMDWDREQKVLIDNLARYFKAPAFG